jgi:hypothetical protein
MEMDDFILVLRMSCPMGLLPARSAVQPPRRAGTLLVALTKHWVV